MNSIQGHMDTLKASYQALSSDLLSSGLLKGIVDIGNGIVNVLDIIITKFGALSTLIAGIATAKGIIGIIGLIKEAGGLSKALEESSKLEIFTSGLTNAFPIATKQLGILKGAVATTFASFAEGQGVIASLSAGFAALSGSIFPIVAGIALVGGAIWGLSKLITTAEESNEKMRNSFASYEEAQGKVNDINGELETTQARISELEGKGGLTLIEQNELDKLKEANDHLEVQSQLQQELANIKAEDAAKDAVKAYNKNFDGVANEANVSQYQRDADSSRNNISLIQEGNVASQIAAIRQFTKLREEAIDNYNTAKDNSDKAGMKWWGEESERYYNLNQSIKESVLEQAQQLEEYKNILEKVPEESLNAEGQSALSGIKETLNFLYSELNPGKLGEEVEQTTDSVETATKAVEEYAQSFDDIKASADSCIGSVNAITEAMSKQKAGESIDADTYNSDELRDYTSALEYHNGVLQYNADKVNEITKAKLAEEKANIANAKAQEQQKYLDNARQIQNYREQLQYASGSERTAIQMSIQALLDENRAISESCKQYDLASSSIDRATSAYQHWINAQSSSQTGEIFDSSLTAMQKINDTLTNSDSDSYGRVGNADYKAALEFIVPETVDSSSQEAVKSYMKDLKKYLKLDDDGKAKGLNIDKFCEEAVKQGLMVFDEASKEYNIAGSKTMEDFANGLNLSMPLVQAIFGELEEFGAEFDWSDEATKTFGDLAIKANESAEALREVDKFSDLNIVLDVSGFTDEQTAVNTLNDDIKQLQDFRATLEVDSSEYQQATDIIQYCIAQRQILTQPAVMTVDTSQVSGSIGEALALLQEFQQTKDTIEMQAEIGADTSDAEAKLSGLVEKIKSSDAVAEIGLQVNEGDAQGSIESFIAGLDAEAIVKMGVDPSVVDAYVPADKDSTVVYGIDTTAPDNYKAPDQNPTVIYGESHSDVTRFINSLHDIKKTVTYTINTVGSPPSGGTHGVNGTAHVSGTACASGNWGTAPGGKTLVGELGKEVVVDPHTGRWYTVGDNGAEFVNVPKNAIVFNHKQSESLLKYGYVAGRGKALASGTAMVTGGKIPSQSSSSTSSSGKSSSSSSKSSSTKKSSSSNSDDSSKKALENFKKWFEKLFDWIEVKLERQADKISNYVKKAENAINSKKFGTAAKNYIDAIKSTATQVTNQYKATDKYTKQANAILKKATASGIISSKTATSIIKKVANGTMDISEYSEGVREVIKSYQEWYDKAKKSKEAIDELHQSIREYINDLKDLRDAQRDAKLEAIDTYSSIATSGLTSSSGGYSGLKNSQLTYENKQLANQNKAYNKEVNAIESDVNSISKKANSSLKSQLKTSNLKATVKNSADRKKYKKALTNAQKAIKAKKKVASADLKVIKKYSKATYERVYAYNLSLDNLEEARLESAVNYASTSAEIYGNVADKYANKDNASKNKIDLYKQKADIADTASEKNSLLEKAASEYETISKNDQAEIDRYAKDVESNRAEISKKNKNHRGSSYKKASQKIKDQVNKYIDKAQNAVSQNKAISAEILAKLAEFYSKGYITYAFYKACIDYNNALESKREAEAQRVIDEATKKAEKAALGTQMVSNIEQEYQNKLNENSSETQRLQTQQSLKTTKGLNLTSRDYNDLIAQSQKEQALYQAEADAIYEQIQKNVASGYWSTSSQEYRDAMNAYNDYKNKAEECAIAQEEYNNAIANLPYEKLEKALDLLESIADYNKSLAELKEAEGLDLSEKDYLDQIEDNNKRIEKLNEERQQAYNDYLRAKGSADGTYGGKSEDEWLSEYNKLGTEINNVKIENERLKDSLRDDVYWRPYKKAHDECERYGETLSDLIGLIDDDMMFDKNGKLTEYGVAQVANLVSQYQNAQREVQNYQNDIANLNRLYAEGQYTQDEYNAKLAELQDGMLESAKDMKSALSQIKDIYKDMAQAELDALFKVIDARQKALSAKKSYYEYDKTIRGKTKDIQSLEAQLAALEGIDTAEAKAKKASLGAQLSDARDDLNDTMQEHAFDLSKDALDELKNTLQDAFDERWKDISSNMNEIENLLASANELTTSSSANIDRALDKLLNYYGINSSSSQIDKMYASGTTSVPKKLRALIGERGSEIATTTQGLVLALDKGDGVLPAEMTENLLNMARGIVPTQINLPNVSAGHNIDGLGEVYNTFESLIHIDGSADAATVEDLKRLAMDNTFIEGLIRNRKLLEATNKFTQDMMYRGYIKSGGKRNM